MHLLAKTEFWQGVIASICVIGCFVLMGLGRDFFVEAVLTAILVGYLGIEIGFFRRKKKKNGGE